MTPEDRYRLARYRVQAWESRKRCKETRPTDWFGVSWDDDRAQDKGFRSESFQGKSTGNSREPETEHGRADTPEKVETGQG